jgi:hypothetical protein
VESHIICYNELYIELLTCLLMTVYFSLIKMDIETEICSFHIKCSCITLFNIVNNIFLELQRYEFCYVRETFTDFSKPCSVFNPSRKLT